MTLRPAQPKPVNRTQNEKGQFTFLLKGDPTVRASAGGQANRLLLRLPMGENGNELTFRTMATQADADAFRTLNEEWILKLFRLEEPDRITLGDPVGEIVSPGGQVYLAACGDHAVGCVALIRHDNGVFELAKMAVAPETRGQGVGRRLLSYALQQGRLLGAQTIVLGSSIQLKNAVHLYESLGFRHVAAAELPIHYERASVWMKLDLA